jgi:alcohol dehydrogenase class IV
MTKGKSMPQSPTPGSLAFRQISPAFRTFAGVSAMAALDKELARSGAHRVVMVHDPALRRFPEALDSVSAALGSRLAATFDEVEPHSPLASVERAAELMRAVSADGVVVVGGGSSVVTARASVIVLGEQRPVRDLCTHRGEDGRLVSPRLSAAKVPMWILPSTPTTAAAKVGAAVREVETGERLALFDPSVRAAGLFLDPALAATAPVPLVRSASFNAFAMTVESLQVNKDNPMADAYLVHAAQLIRENVPLLADDSTTDSRLQLMSAALLSGHGSDAAGGGLAQALAHAIGPAAGVPNGVVEILLLPHAVRFNAVSDPVRLSRLAAAIGGGEAASASADDVADALETVLASWDVPLRFRDLGVEEASLEEAAEHALHDWALTQAPRVPDRDQLRALLSAAW